LEFERCFLLICFRGWKVREEDIVYEEELEEVKEVDEEVHNVHDDL
jgi:hypothetical protein